MSSTDITSRYILVQKSVRGLTINSQAYVAANENHFDCDVSKLFKIGLAILQVLWHTHIAYTSL